MYICIYVYTQVDTHAHTHTILCIFMYICIYISAEDLHPSALTQVDTHIHTHTHTRQADAFALSEQQWMRVQHCCDSFIYITAPLARLVISGKKNIKKKYLG